MITKFEDFILEKAFFLINESILTYSDDFISLLKKIDSPISTALLRLRNDDKDLVANYFDIDTRDTITFISDKKAKELEEKEYYRVGTIIALDTLLEISRQTNFLSLTRVSSGSEADTTEKLTFEEILIGAGVTWEKNWQEKFTHVPKRDEIGELVVKFYYNAIAIYILKVEENLVVTYGNIEKVNPSFHKNRQPIRIGRGIKALTKKLGLDFTDAEIEVFVNKWKANFDIIKNGFGNFEIVAGEMIAHWYSSTNYYHPNKGQLGSSCMKAKPDWFFEIYTENPEVCNLLILKSTENNNLITGRALVWKLDDGRFIMDRVYTNNDEDIILFVKYAQYNGWLYKKSAYIDLLCFPDGTEAMMSVSVSIKNEDYTGYPYVDTLRYLTTRRSGSWTLSNYDDGCDWTLDSTSGGRSSTVCEYCGGSGTVTCNTCDGEGEIVPYCPDCEGVGKNKCENCYGEGYTEEGDECEQCNGSKFRRCGTCLGTGLDDPIECDSCEGRGTRDCPDC